MNSSENIAELAGALSKFQGEVRDASKDKSAYGYQYADLHQVLEIARPLLAKHGLSVTQLLEDGSDQAQVETVLLHGSGQWISSTLSMPVTVGKGMTQAQAVGSVSTYARRYALAAVLGITQSDDDGGAGRTAKGVEEKRITKAQVNALQKLIDATKTDTGTFTQWLCGVEDLEQIPSSMAAKARKALQDKQKAMETERQEKPPQSDTVAPAGGEG